MTRATGTVIAAAALWATSPAVAAEAAFNMVCVGTKMTRSGEGVTSQPYTLTYRIRLDERSWCEGECRTVHEIEQLEPAYLLLQWTRGSIAASLYNRIDRETGAHDMGQVIRPVGRPEADIERTWEGRCEKAPFSGFPEARTGH